MTQIYSNINKKYKMIIKNIKWLINNFTQSCNLRWKNERFITNLDKHTPVLGVLGEPVEGKSTLLNNIQIINIILCIHIY